MSTQIVTVVGGTGSQGGGVVDALLADGTFAVRVPTRNPASDAARALAARGVEVVGGDLLEPATLGPAFEGAYGAFVVSNFWDPAQASRETEVASGAVKAARAAGVQHLVWSTLPNSKALTDGRLEVVHFTGKALVDDVVRAAGFARHTFVMAPFYFQNLATVLAPQPLPTGKRGWAIPIAASARVIHAGDVREVGKAVAAAFAAREALPDGSYLGVCGGTYSFADFAATLNANGHDVEVLEVPPAAYDGFFPGAHEMREMFQYFVEKTYFGPDHAKAIAAARALVPGGFTSFEDWAKVHMKTA